MSYPLVREPGRALPGGAGDCAGFLWSMDTFWTHVAAGETPWYTCRILFPIGLSCGFERLTGGGSDFKLLELSNFCCLPGKAGGTPIRV